MIGIYIHIMERGIKGVRLINNLIVFRSVVDQINDISCFPRILNCVCLLPRFSGAGGQEGLV